MGALYLTITLERVIVGDYELRGAAGELPIGQVELKYAKIAFACSGDGATESIAYDQATSVFA